MHCSSRRGAIVAFAIAGLALLGCSSDPFDPQQNLSPERAAAPARPTGSDGSPAVADGELRPAVVVNGRPVSWEDVWTPMAEHSGGAIVSEVVLDSILEQEMADRGITIGSDAVERERAALTRTIVEGVGVSDLQAQQLARQVTEARGLGPHRMEKLLRRNAMLRELARESAPAGEAEFRRAYEIEHGRRYVTRVITVATDREASDLRAELLAGPPESLRSRFAEAAVARSTDPTGASGGMLGPISPADTTLPPTLREMIQSTPPGTVTAVMLFDGSFALGLVEGVLEPSGVPYEQVRPAIEASVRDRVERLQMDVIAREMLDSARVSVFDRSLNWGWDTRVR